jgi:hypothetical protein
MMKIQASGLFVILAVAWVLWPRYHTVTVTPEADLEITFSIWAMQSLHSDWHRKVSIEYRGTSIDMRLFEDTGWWRGSNLYLHNSGTYVVNEGQSGCFAFTVEPTEFVKVPDGSCMKRSFLELDRDQGSKLSKDLIYIGRFQETYRDAEGVRLRYFDASQSSEVELPGAL